jgi:DNA-binding MarR family transcriptional regulator
MMSIIQTADEQDKKALVALSNAINQFRDPATGSPMPMIMVRAFLAVAQRDRVTVQDVSKATGITQSAVSRQLSDLAGKNRNGGAGLGLVDQRIEGTATLNSLTPKGQILARRMAAEMRRGQVKAAA